MSDLGRGDGLTVGDIVVETDVELSRDTLVRYAGASGDFNAIHYRDDVARSVGLPGVLAHGMLTMAAAAQPLVEWLHGRGTVVDYQVRFTRPVPVDADAGARLHIVARVGQITDESTRFDLVVTLAGETVLGKAQLRVAFA